MRHRRSTVYISGECNGYRREAAVVIGCGPDYRSLGVKNGRVQGATAGKTDVSVGDSVELVPVVDRE